MALRTRIPQSLVSPILVVALVSAALAAPSSASASAWVASQTLTENPVNNNSPTPQIAGDPAGDQALVLRDGKASAAQTIQVATRAPGGPWSTPLTQLIGTTAGTVGTPALAMDPAGNAVLAFSDDQTAATPCTVGGGTACLHLLFKPAGGSTFTEEKRLSVSQVVTPVVAMDPAGNGNATVVWTRSPTALQALAEGVQRSGGGWSAIQTVFPQAGESFSNVRVAYDATSAPVVVLAAESPFQCTTGCVDTLRTAAFNGSWQTGQIEQSTTDRYDQAGGDVYVGRDLNGQLSTIFVRTNYTNNAQTIRTATRPLGAGTAWNPTTGVFTPPSGDSVGTPQMVTAADGSSLAVWRESTGTGAQFNAAASRPAGGAFGTPVTVDSGSVSAPAAAQDAAGNALIAWTSTTTGTIRFAQEPHGGALGGTFDAAGNTSGAAPVLASDNAGDVSLVTTSGGATLQTLVFDGAAPGLTLGAPPATTFHPGDPVPFAATTSDLWSNPVSVHWDFNDGKTADGLNVSHAYATAGTYNARAIATDAAGNTTTQTVTATISPPPGLPPPLLGVSINVFVIKDPIYIKLPGEKKFHRLIKQAHLPNGTVIDARRGIALVVIDNGAGGQDSARFYEGIFEVNQPKTLHGLANIFLNGGGFKGCPKAPKDPHAQLSRGKKLSPDRSIRHLWGKGTGKFRTVGRFASASVRGTQWLTDDRCDGTNVRVKQGKVLVRDFVRRKNIALSAPKSYFARAKR